MSSSSWVYCMPEDDVEHFSERSDERRQFFEDTASRLPTTELSPLIWAFFQVGNLERLRDHAHSDVSWKGVFLESKPSLLELEAKDAILLWRQHSTAKYTTPTPN